jgi:hypothetical protein
MSTNTTYTLQDDGLDLDQLLGNLTISGSTDYSSQNYNYSSGTYSINPSNSISLGAISGGAIGATTGIWQSTTGTSVYDSPTVNLGHHGINVVESADIKLGDTSLKQFIKSIEERLAILQPNPKLEKEWTELKELGDRYRELEKQITEKMKTWDILKRED